MMQIRQTHMLTAIIALIFCATMMQPFVSMAGAAGWTAPVGVGTMAPDFTLEDQDGHKVTLSQARGQMPVVLVFYRGSW